MRSPAAATPWRSGSDLVDEHGFAARYASVRRFVVTLRGRGTAEAHPVIVTAPGEEAQVDYGEGPMVRDPDTGKYRRTRLFVLTLGYSRKSVRLLTFGSSTPTLGRAARAGVSPARRCRARRGPRQSARGRAHARHLRSHPQSALPRRARALRRRRAAVPRRAIPIARAKSSRRSATRRAPLEGLRFETPGGGPGVSRSLGGALGRHPHPRHHQAPGRGHVRRGAAAPRSRCRSSRFATTSTARRTVHLDGYVEVACAYYAAPPGWLGREVAVQWDGAQVRLLDPTHGPAAARARRQAPGRPAHPARGSAPAHATARPLTLLARAARAGAHIGTLCTTIHRRDGELGVRRILGVLALAQAARRRRRRRRLRRRAGDGRRRPTASSAATSSASPRCALTLRQVDPLIRELTHYRDLIARLTQEEESRHESRRTAARPAPAPLLRHGRRPGDPPARSPDRARCARRLPLDPRPGRAHPPCRTACSTGACSRRASATAARRSIPSTSTSTRR